MESNETYGIFLVIPSGLSESSVRMPLRQSCEMLLKQEVDHSWIHEEECLKMADSMNGLFVCDPFDGAAYNHLFKIKCRILGPLVLLDCLRNKCNLPRHPLPIFSLNMRGTVVTFSNILPDLKRKLKDMVFVMGGNCINNFTQSVTHLVIGCVGSDKYKTAVSLKLPIHTPNWIFQCWSATQEEVCELKHCTDSEYDKFSCGPFHGLLVTASQFDSEFRKTIQTCIESNGGKYSGAMKCKETTHLILEMPSGNKFQYAQSWNVKCVSKDWIFDCISEGKFLPEDPYIVQTDHRIPLNKASTPKKDEAPFMDPNISMMVQPERMNETCLSNVSFVPTMVKPKSKENINCYLAGCIIYLSGFTAKEHSELETLTKVSGARVCKSCSQSVTHVVVKSGEKIGNIVILPTVKVVLQDWLSDCVKNRRRLTEENYLVAQIPEEGSLPKLNISQKENVGEDKIDNVSYLEKSESMIYNNNSHCLNQRQSQNQLLCLFSNMFFEIYGFNSEDEEILQEMLETHGGVVQTSNLPENRILVLPFAQERSFVLPNNVSIRTSCWVQMCLEKETILPLNGHRLFFPISLPESEPLKNCILTFSQFMGTEKDCLMMLAKELGATCSQFFVRYANKNKGLLPSTHLILSSPEGNKYVAAKKWGVPAIHKAWLYKAACLGAKPNEEEFCINKPVPDVPIDSFEGQPKISVDLPQQGTSLKVDYHEKADINIPMDVSQMDFLQTDDNTNKDCQIGIKEITSWKPDFDFTDAMTTLDARIAEDDEKQKMQRRSLSLVEMANHHMAIARKNFNLASPVSEPEELEDTSCKPLRGVVLCVSRRLASQQNKLHLIAKELGAKVVYSYSSICTHFIHQGKPLEHSVPGIKELRQAVAQKKHVVSPDWLIACRNAQTHVSEQNFPYTFNKRLSLSGQILAHKLDSTQNFSTNGKKVLTGRINEDTSSLPSDVKNTSLPINPNNLSSNTHITETVLKPSKSRILESNKAQYNVGLTKQMQELLTARKASLGPAWPQNRSTDSKSRISPHKWLPAVMNEPEALHTQQSQSCPIMWEDPTEKREHERLAQRPITVLLDEDSQEEDEDKDRHPDIATTDKQDLEVIAEIPTKRKVFMLSGLQEDSKVNCVTILRDLGAEILEGFSPDVTHLISDLPSKNEKVLCALAAGLWVLNSDFVLACAEAGRFLSEEDYEWGNPTSKCLLEKLAPKYATVAKASYRWRCHVSETKLPSFSDWQVKLFVSNIRVENYSRILKAGGAKLVDTFTDTRLKKFAFIDGQTSFDMTSLSEQNVTCCKPEYFSVVLVENPPPPPDAYAVTGNKSRENSAAKRKINESRNVTKRHHIN